MPRTLIRPERGQDNSFSGLEGPGRPWRLGRPQRCVAVAGQRRGEGENTDRQAGVVQFTGEYAPGELRHRQPGELHVCLLVGDGAIRYREVFEGLNKVEIVDDGLSFPSATSLVQLAHAQALREQFVKSWELAPLYLRKPDAEINWTTRESA